MKKLLSSLLFIFAAMVAMPAFADDPCKNLFDPTKIDAEHYYALKSGEYIYNDVISVSDLIPVISGQKYTISGRSSHANTITHMHTFWNANHEFVSGGYGPNTNSSNPDAVWTVTVPNNVSYLRFSFHAGDQNTFQVEEGETATTHVPYNPLCATCDGRIENYVSATGTVAQNGTPTPTNPITPTFYTQGDMVLRRVVNWADSYDATTGKITRRIGVKVLDGTEDFTYDNPLASMFNLRGIQTLVYASDRSVYSTHFKTSVTLPNQSERYGFIERSAGGYIGIGYLLANGSVDAFKSWVAEQYAAGTPVTIYYPLATAVEEDWPAEQCIVSNAIKIATTAYNTARFSPVVTDLNSTVATIREIVTKTINQTAAIASLQADKQTRPNENCPAGKKCLLVETEENGVIVPHWYPIIESADD